MWPDWFPAVQERFWSQLQRLKPESYVASGDRDVVVSRNQRFIDGVRQAAERAAGRAT
jgi:hypothetical protein